MKVRVLPRLQVENWSLYWKESLQTQTKCFAPVDLELPGDDATVADLLVAHQRLQGWQPAPALLRLDGFTGPWERLLLQGRELQPGQLIRDVAAGVGVGGVGGSASAAAAPPPLTLTLVRVVLKADGWKIRQPDDFLSDSSDSDDEE